MTLEHIFNYNHTHNHNHKFNQLTQRVTSGSQYIVKSE